MDTEQKDNLTDVAQIIQPSNGGNNQPQVPTSGQETAQDGSGNTIILNPSGANIVTK